MTVLDVPGPWSSLLEAGPGRDRLEREVLPASLPGRRWFAGKARPLAAARVAGAAALEGVAHPTFLALARIEYGDGGAPDLYFLPLVAVAEGDVPPDAVLARLRGPGGDRVLADGVADPATCRALLGLIASGRAVPAGAGTVRGRATTAFAAARGPAEVPGPIRPGSSEQSNSAILFGDRLILKVFRRLEPGLNPDYEIGRFLSEETTFSQVPRTAGVIVFEPEGAEPMTLGILQALVPNQGTGWEHALGVLARYYEGLGRHPELLPPAGAENGSLLELAATAPPPAVTRVVGAYLPFAAVLGRRTAELHQALAGGTGYPDFAPEPLSADDLAGLGADIRDQVDSALATLRARLGRLAGPVAARAREVLGRRDELLGAIRDLAEAPPSGAKIRVHGDYHLGQVLRAGDDFVILDFEGEPARPLARRRAKQPAIKDVAGMIRSFDYAAHAALFAATEGRSADRDRLAPWAASWRSWIAAAFLRQYLATAGPAAAFLPTDRGLLGRLLRAFLLDKALYELQYELNNRPDWVAIPLEGVRALLGRPDRSGDDAAADS